MSKDGGKDAYGPPLEMPSTGHQSAGEQYGAHQAFAHQAFKEKFDNLAKQLRESCEVTSDPIRSSPK